MVNNPAPTCDTSDWRAGFEIEMLFGDLGLKRYRKVIEDEGGYDTASLSYCRAIAERLTKLTGQKWIGSEEPTGTGFFVVPEHDLDPIHFSENTVGGVELVTPPLPMPEAEEIRRNIVTAIQGMENGLQPHFSETHAGWHVNIDKGPHDRGIEPSRVCAALWQAGDDELDLLLVGDRYGDGFRSAAPQHHAYGPALLTALHSPLFPMNSHDLHSFLHHHCGRSKRYAINFEKLSRNYIELRHLGLDHFLDDVVSIDSYFTTIFRAVDAAPINSRPYMERLHDRFTLLGEWLHPLQQRIAIQTRDRSRVRGQEGRMLFDGSEIARLSWNGIGEIYLGADEDRWKSRDDILDNCVLPELTTGLDADEIMAGVAILAMDSLSLEGHDLELPRMPNSFLDELSVLKNTFKSHGLIEEQDWENRGASRFRV